MLVTNGDGAGVLLGYGDGAFQAVQTYASGGYSRIRSRLKINGDGKLDTCSQRMRQQHQLRNWHGRRPAGQWRWDLKTARHLVAAT